jgi:hypothetical protein
MRLADVIQMQDRNIRNLELRDFFAGSDHSYDPEAFDNKFLGKSSWSPPFAELTHATQQAVLNIQSETSELLEKCISYRNNIAYVHLSNRHTDNLTRAERSAINTLGNDDSIIIKPADKGGAVVVMNRDCYMKEAFRQLYNVKYYVRIDAPLSASTTETLNSIIDEIQLSGFINDKQHDFLHVNVPSTTRAFYLLPKVHKAYNKWPFFNMPEGRPIVSDVNSETYNICQYIDYFLKPLACKHASYVKDTYDFIHQIRDKSIPSDAYIVTGDITSLYTNMHIDLSLQCVREIFDVNPDPRRPDAAILRLLEVCLRRNDFEFAGQYFLQIMGTAMGKSFAPNLANIYLLKFDEAIRTGFHINPLLFFRFIDDIFFIWPSSLQELLNFQSFLNNVLPDIKVTFNTKCSIVEFLDTLVYKHHEHSATVLRTRVFFKNTDTHQLLHTSSFHPTHTCKGILKSQLIRFKRICSTYHEYKHAAHVLFAVLKQRGYTYSLFRRLLYDTWHSNISYVINRSSSAAKSNNPQKWPIINFYDDIGVRITRHTRRYIASLNIANSYRLISAYRIHRNLAHLLTRSKISA